MERAVHRPQLILSVVERHAGEHVLGVEVVVAGRLPKICARDVRRVNQRVPALQILVAHPVFDGLADDAAFGMKENQPRTSEFLNAEQIQLFAQLAMVAALGFFHPRQEFVELFLAEKRRAVDALQLRIALFALPIRP